MNKIFVYTKAGCGNYDNHGNYKGHTGKLCDLEQAIHFAVSVNDGEVVTLRNDTGILFAKADYSTGKPGGVTKCLNSPWIFRKKDGSFGILAIRSDEDDEYSGDDDKSVLFFSSKDLTTFTEDNSLKLSDKTVSKPQCEFNEQRGKYSIKWFDGECWYEALSADLASVDEVSKIEEPAVFSTNEYVGNSIQITDEEAKNILDTLGEIRNTDAIFPKVKTEIYDGSRILHLEKQLVCIYSDGSTDKKSVTWNEKDMKKLFRVKPGEYTIRGEVSVEYDSFPFIKKDVISDPSITKYKNNFYLCYSQSEAKVDIRVADTIKKLKKAKPVTIWKDKEKGKHKNMWAPEMHIIKGIPYIFTTLSDGEWTSVKAHVLRCNGDPADPKAWEDPRLVVRPDGSELEPEGISLDMTYFEDNGKSYVMWSDRKVIDPNPDDAVCDSANIMIATVDPDNPWQLTGEPVCILKPMYGWDRCETEVEEGPYMFRKGNDIFVTVSGSSTALADLYCVGLLKTETGKDLLNKDNWTFLNYPVLTKESVPGEFGPGHNSVFQEDYNGDHLLIYHAVPHKANGKTLNRRMGIRRIHWRKNGLPYFEMTPERDIKPEFRKFKVKVIVE